MKLNGKYVITKVINVLFSLLLIGCYYNHLWLTSIIKRDWLLHTIETHWLTGIVWSKIQSSFLCGSLDFALFLLLDWFSLCKDGYHEQLGLGFHSNQANCPILAPTGPFRNQPYGQENATPWFTLHQIRAKVSPTSHLAVMQ